MNYEKIITILAGTFTSMFASMHAPQVKAALDVTYYGMHIDLYIPIYMISCLGTLIFSAAAVAIKLSKTKLIDGN